MITLSIVAAGIIALAAALLARSTPEPRAAERATDQRGITLQTLIVTAVLVAMAVVAGAVILAITSAQRENLEGQSRTSSGDANCEPWEIYDLARAAAGRGGGQGGVGSSGNGCIRVCYIRHTTANNNIATTDDITDGTDGAANLELVMSRSNIATTTNAATANVQTVLVVVGENDLAVSNTDSDDDVTTNIMLNALEIIPVGETTARTYDEENMSIRVASSQDYCEIVDPDGDELLRSVDA